MKKVTIYGASDDLIEAEGCEGCDEFGAWGPEAVVRNTLALKAGGSTVNIHCLYDGAWSFAISPQDGDCDEMPDWSIRREWGRETPYSEFLEIEVPDDAVLRKLDN